MSIDALISGHLHGAPKSRTSQNGNVYTTVVVRCSSRDGGTVFVNVIGFDRAVCQALEALSAGDSVAISGEASIKVFTPASGEPRPSVDLLAHAVLTEYHVARKRRATQDARAGDDHLPFDDDLPRGAA